jgi:hypothetical protein
MNPLSDFKGAAPFTFFYSRLWNTFKTKKQFFSTQNGNPLNCIKALLQPSRKQNETGHFKDLSTILFLRPIRI